MAADKLYIPKDIQKELKCGFCGNCLSVPSIKVIDINDGSHICGRCVDNFPNTGLRATAYESVAKLLLFPCRYSKKGCKKQITFAGALDHEIACDFRSYGCPALPLNICSWQGPIKGINSHFSASHPNLLLDIPFFQIPLNGTDKLNKILVAFEEVFLVQYVCEDKKFYISVKYVGKPPDSGKYTYEIEMRGGVDRSAVTLFNKPTKPAITYDFDKKNMNIIEVESLKSILSTKEIYCYVKILEKGAAARANETETDDNTTKSTTSKSSKVKKNKKVPQNASKDIDINLLNELECPVCQEYMIPPIYICSIGHSICSDCKEKIRHKCPTCNAPLSSNTRNYTLEKLTLAVKYPCKNSVEGCKFIGNSKTIRDHEITCSTILINCPLQNIDNCRYKGHAKAVYEHAKLTHPNNAWVKMNEHVYRDIKSQIFNDYQVVLFDDHLFRILCSHAISGNVQWTFSQWDLKQEDLPKYRFEIEFFDQGDYGRKLVIGDLCYPTHNSSNPFAGQLVIPCDLLRPYFTSDHRLIFKYNIHLLTKK